MGKFNLCILILILLTSCSVQNKESLEFESYNAALIGGKKTTIKFISTDSKRKRNVIVNVTHRNEPFYVRRITSATFKEILGVYENISIQDTAKVVWIDPPTLKVKYTSQGTQKDFVYYGIPTKDEKFFKLGELILEAADLNFKDLE